MANVSEGIIRSNAIENLRIIGSFILKYHIKQHLIIKVITEELIDGR